MNELVSGDVEIQRIMNSVVGSWRLEGLPVDNNDLLDIKSILKGESTADEVIDKIIAELAIV